MAWAAPVQAATPRQIYLDFADNGRLDGTYSPAELRRALEDAAIAGYGGPDAVVLRPTVERRLNRVLGAQATSQAPAGQGGALPFTGVDLMLIVAGGGTLLACGLAIRRLAE
jgi:hypothetical protein